MSNLEKRKHKTLSLSDKCDIIKRLSQGEKQNDLANQYSVGRATIYDIKKNRMKIETFVKTGAYARGERQTMKMGDNPKVDEALYAWFLQERSRNTPINGDILKDKAKFFYKEITGKDDFRASDGWLDKLKKRYGLHFPSMLGGESPTHHAAMDLFMEKSSSSDGTGSSSTKRTSTEDRVEETLKRLKTEEEEVADEEEWCETQQDVTTLPAEEVVTKIEVSSDYFEDGTALEQDVEEEMAREQEDGETSTSPPTAAIYLPEESQPSAFCESEEVLPNVKNQDTLDSRSAKVSKVPVYHSEDDVMNKILEIVSTSSDDNQIFGDFVASSLRSLHSEQIRRRLKRKIQIAILEESELDERNYTAGQGTSSRPGTVQLVSFDQVNRSQRAQNNV